MEVLTFSWPHLQVDANTQMREGDVKGSTKTENCAKTGDNKPENLTDVSRKDLIFLWVRRGCAHFEKEHLKLVEISDTFILDLINGEISLQMPGSSLVIGQLFLETSRVTVGRPTSSDIYMFLKRILENFKLLLFQSNNPVESKDGVSAAVKRSISPTNEEKHSEKKLKSANEVNLLKIYFSLVIVMTVSWSCVSSCFACENRMSSRNWGSLFSSVSILDREVFNPQKGATQQV